MRIVLPRTGDRPLAFDGDRLAEASSRQTDATRWHELELHRTAGGYYVVGIFYRTQWQGETEYNQALMCETPDAVLQAIRSVDPIAHLIGFPPGAQFESRQKRLERELVQGYRAASSKILKALGPEEIR